MARTNVSRSMGHGAIGVQQQLYVIYDGIPYCVLRGSAFWPAIRNRGAGKKNRLAPVHLLNC
jgi:hypothetical protein